MPRRRGSVGTKAARKQKGSESHPEERRPKKTTKSDELVGRKPWIKEIDICGQRYRIMIDPEWSPKKNEAQCCEADNQIDVLEQAEDRMHDSLIHETLHAMTDASGLRWKIATTFKLTLAERRHLDEMICRALAPAILSSFRSAGWLRLPGKPRHRSAKHGK